MSETEGAFRLTFVQGRGLLTMGGRDFPGVGRVDSLELEIPNLSFPFDLSGGITRFKNRRLRLKVPGDKVSELHPVRGECELLAPLVYHNSR